MNPETKGRKVTPHHWIIETTYNSKTFRLTTNGFCNDCGKIRRFPNGLSSPYEALRDPNDIQHGNRLLVKREFGNSQ